MGGHFDVILDPLVNDYAERRGPAAEMWVAEALSTGTWSLVGRVGGLAVPVETFYIFFRRKQEKR